MSESNENIQDQNGDMPEHSPIDVVEQYWQSGCTAYHQAMERAETTESSDDIKPISTSASYQSFASTRIGGRMENQDTAAFRQIEDGMLLAVCDGMGGGPAGKRASLLAAHVITQYVAENYGGKNVAELLTEAIQLAHNVLKLDSSINPQNHGMGTTAAVMLINGEKATLAHVGDSRIYQIRDGKMLFRTKDHSLVARRMELEGWTDEEARTSSDSNVITQAVGHAEIEPEIDIRSYLKGDRFLLCSDGIWGHFPQEELMKIAGGASTPGGALSDLMVTADTIGIEEGNTHDNLTAIILETYTNSKLEDIMTKRSKLIILILGILLLVSIAFNVILIARNGNATSGAEKQEHNSTDIITDVIKEKGSKSSETPDNTSNTITAADTSAEQVMVTDTVYVIQSGETVSKIAVRFHVSVDEIKQANPNIDLNKIKPGQTLSIPKK